MRNFLLAVATLFIFVFCNHSAFSQEKTGIKWMSFEVAVHASEKNPKKIFVDLYTDWCGWCKRLDATTFADARVVNYMNANYYSVKLNAEKKDTIHFKGYDFKVPEGGKTNELAIALMQGKLTGYPSSAFLNEKFEIIHAQSGYLTSEKFLPIIEFIAGDVFLTSTWDEFEKNYSSKK